MLDVINAIAFMWLIPAVVFIFWGGTREGVFTVTKAFSGSQQASDFSSRNARLGRNLIIAGIIMIALSIAWFYVFSKIAPASPEPAQAIVPQATQ